MKTQKLIITLMVVCASAAAATTPAFAWGQKGHDVTCSIAGRHLTKKAAKEVSRIFEGKSMVYWANWMDNASHTPEFSYTKTWHYKNIDADETYETAAQDPSGDVITAITAQMEALRSGTLNPEAEAYALRMLIHMVGDLHCPMHVSHKSDAGGNRWQVQFFNSGKNLHSIWDTDLLESAHKWTYSEWTDQLDRVTKAEVKEMTAGSLDDWGAQTYEIAKHIYETTPVGTRVSYDYVSESAPIIERQLLLGGLRLASILNEIFK